MQATAHESNFLFALPFVLAVVGMMHPHKLTERLVPNELELLQSFGCKALGNGLVLIRHVALQKQ